MVKGVSRTIIEVNNTGSKLFEKIVFYVTPEYGNLNAKQLKRAATEFSFNYDSAVKKNSLRNRCRRKRNIRILLISALVLTLFVTALVIIL